MKTRLLLLLFWVVNTLMPNVTYGEHQKQIVGYYPSWQWYDRGHLVNPETIFYEKYTVLNYAFFSPLASGAIESTDPWADENLLLGPMVWWPEEHNDSTKSLPYLASQHGVKLLASIGGWNDSHNFPGIAADPAKRQVFIESCLDLIDVYNFDGIDLDWEYPGYAPHNGTPDDKYNFTLLVQELRQALDEYGQSRNVELLLTSSFGASEERMENIDWENILPYLDMINLMTYDFHGSWDALSNHHTPLYPVVGSNPDLCIDGAFQLLTNNFGVPPEVINIGLSFNGKALANCTGLHQPHSGYDSATFPDDSGQPLYYNILEKMDLFSYHWDDTVKCPYLLGNSINTFVTFDDEASMAYKAQYVIDNNAMGVIIWEITGDYVETFQGSGEIEGTPLLDTIIDVFSSTMQYNMQIVAKLELPDGSTSLNPDDIVAGFVGDECRGLASPLPSVDGIIFLTIGSNEQSGEMITFQAYLADSDQIVDLDQSFAFENMGEVGTVLDPFMFTFDGEEPEDYTLTLVANPSEGGTVSGGGVYNFGEQVNITATANTGWQFVNWTDADGIICVSPTFTYTMPAASVTLTANFEMIDYTLSVTPSSRNVTHTAGLTTFSISSNTSWTVSESCTWLSVSPANGSNNATLTVNYDENNSTSPRSCQITVTPSGGGSPVTVTVNQEGDESCTPDWQPVTNLQYNMQVVAQIILDDNISLNPNDVLGAFVGDECRGVASPMPGVEGRVFLTVGSNVTSGEIVELRIWNSELCESCDAAPGFEFVSQGEVGTHNEPHLVTCGVDVDLTLNYGQGFTWFSVNVDPGSMLLNPLFEDLAPCVDDRLIGQTQFALWTGTEWVGGLTEIDHTSMYRMRLCSNQSITISGAPAPLDPISLNPGFTWLGYLPEECQPVNNALESLTPVYDDRIIGQNAFALFSGTQWVGSLLEMCPGEGYIIRLANPDVLTYSMYGKGSMDAEKRETTTSYSPAGVYPDTHFQHTMMLLAKLDLGKGRLSLNPGDVVYAFVDGECRGMASPMPKHEGTIFMNIGSDSDIPQEVNFKVWLDEMGQLVDINERISFQPLGAVGTIDNALILTMDGTVDIPDLDTDGWHIGEPYPNPFSGYTTVSYSIAGAAKITIRVFNTTGQLIVAKEINKESAGNYAETVERGQLSPGMYFISVEINAEERYLQRTDRLIVK